MTPISLIGLPGGGKTTTGRQLARRLSRPFLDTDTLIEQRIGEPIRSFFETQGEERFRDVEERVIDEVLERFEGVLATGGGAVLRPANRSRLHNGSVVFYLVSNPDALYRRLRFDVKRPLLQGADPLTKLHELHAKRDPLYRETAHFQIATGRPTVPTIVMMILAQLELAGIVDPYRVPSLVDPVFPPLP